MMNPETTLIEFRDVESGLDAFGTDGWGAELASVIRKLVRPDACWTYCDEGSEAEEIEIAKKEMLGWYEATLPRYQLLLTYLRANQQEMFGAVKVTSRNWFNDAPQSKNLDGNSEDLTHLTTFGKGESVDPRGTMMARIAEVQDQYRNLLFDWAKEFIGYFGLNRRK